MTRKPTDDEQPSEDVQPLEQEASEEAAEPQTPVAGVVYANPGPPSASSSEEGGR